MFWIEALKAFHCMESSWRNNSRDCCLVLTGKLHHAVAGGERETPVLVRLKLLDGRCGMHKMDNSVLVATYGAVWGYQEQADGEIWSYRSELELPSHATS